MGSVATLIHPLDPLSTSEITLAISVVKKHHSACFFNVVSLHEPRKADMLAWLSDPSEALRPARVADCVIIAKGGAVYDILVDLETLSIVKTEALEGVQPIVCLPRAVPRLG